MKATRHNPGMFSLHRQLKEKGYHLVAGVDEAGRGPLAGPVIAAAVILRQDDLPSLDLNDSKALSAAKREEIFAGICSAALAWAVGAVSVSEIDALNIYWASLLAMRRAIERLSLRPQFVVVDGNQTIPDIDLPQMSVVRGDAKVAAVAAASIVAKVTRDRIMRELDFLFPNYEFAQHKGYGTKKHLQALQELGPTLVHRCSFSPVRNILEKKAEKNV